ncbi:hypothetical protein CRUP_033985 [Coryphaenoides rupestris]|nr:hypothetical protein CRUP_033985 [Coryphaenoides rupestris]
MPCECKCESSLGAGCSRRGCQSSAGWAIWGQASGSREKGQEDTGAARGHDETAQALKRRREVGNVCNARQSAPLGEGAAALESNCPPAGPTADRRGKTQQAAPPETGERRARGAREEITNTTEKLTSAKHPIDTSASKPNFLPVPSDWPICRHHKYFSLPNYFNHTTAEEVEAFLKQWEWLVRDGCYRNSEWFLCLLATPKHPSDPAGNGNRSTAMLPARRHLPCCSFCHHLRDSCWAKLEGSDFPVDCDSLPTEGGCPPCLSVNKQKAAPKADPGHQRNSTRGWLDNATWGTAGYMVHMGLHPT